MGYIDIYIYNSIDVASVYIYICIACEFTKHVNMCVYI